MIATKTALKLADYVVTEAGFGADLGRREVHRHQVPQVGAAARSSSVLVATIRALKYHGGVELEGARHARTCRRWRRASRTSSGTSTTSATTTACRVVVASTTSRRHRRRDRRCSRSKIAHHDAPVVVARHWADGGDGRRGRSRARSVELIDTTPADFQFVYDDADTLWEKMTKVATEDLRRDRGRRRQQGRARRSRSCRRTATATTRSASPRRSTRSRRTRCCAARRPATSSTSARCASPPAPEFVVMICGDVMTMPGLPKEPSAAKIDVTRGRQVVGLF